MDFVLHLQHSWSENREAAAGNTNRLQAKGNEMWRRNKLQATVLSFGNWKHSLCCLYYSPILAKKHPPTHLHQEWDKFPCVSVLGLSTRFPPVCGCACSAPACLQRPVTHVWVTQMLLDSPCVRRTVTTTFLNWSSQLRWCRLETSTSTSVTTTGGDLFRQHKHSRRGLCSPTPLPWLLWLAGQGAVQPRSGCSAWCNHHATGWLHVCYHPQQHHTCSLACSTNGSSTRDHHFPPKRRLDIFNMEIGVLRSSEKEKGGRKICRRHGNELTLLTTEKWQGVLLHSNCL